MFFFRRLFCMQQRLPRGLQEDMGACFKITAYRRKLSLFFSTIYSLDLPSHALFFLPFFGIMQLLVYENKAHMYGREQP